MGSTQFLYLIGCELVVFYAGKGIVVQKYFKCDMDIKKEHFRNEMLFFIAIRNLYR